MSWDDGGRWAKVGGIRIRNGLEAYLNWSVGAGKAYKGVEANARKGRIGY